MPKRKTHCAGKSCTVYYRPERKGCGGRQTVQSEYLLQYEKLLLKDGAEVGDWICLTHRNELRMHAPIRPPKRRRHNESERMQEPIPMTDGDESVKTEELDNNDDGGDDDYNPTSSSDNSDDSEDGDEQTSSESDCHETTATSAASVLTSLRREHARTNLHSNTAAARSASSSTVVTAHAHAATATASAVRLQRSRKRKVQELTAANAKVTKRIHRLHSRVKRRDNKLQIAEEEMERMDAHAKQLQTESNEKDEKLEWLKRQSQHTRKQLADSKQYRKKVAGDKKDLVREVAATRAALDESEREVVELLEDYEQLQLETLLLGEPPVNDKEQENELISVFHPVITMNGCVRSSTHSFVPTSEKTELRNSCQ